MEEDQPYPDHPERFDEERQVLCREGLTGRHYWEVEVDEEWYVVVGVTYRSIGRRGRSPACRLGHNDRSWGLSGNPGVSLDSLFSTIMKRLQYLSDLRPAE